MKWIRFGAGMTKRIREGRKIRTFRTTRRKLGDYKIAEAGHPFYEYVDTGVRIRITECFPVDDVVEYARRYFREEGFSSPEEFLDYLRGLRHDRKLPKAGYGHVFELMGGGS